MFSTNDDTTLLQTRTKQLLLLARIREKSGHLNSSLATLKEARDNQYRLQNRIVVEQSASVQEQNAILSKLVHYLDCFGFNELKSLYNPLLY